VLMRWRTVLGVFGFYKNGYGGRPCQGPGNSTDGLLWQWMLPKQETQTSPETPWDAQELLWMSSVLIPTGTGTRNAKENGTVRTATQFLYFWSKAFYKWYQDNGTWKKVRWMELDGLARMKNACKKEVIEENQMKDEYPQGSFHRGTQRRWLLIRS